MPRCRVCGGRAEYYVPWAHSWFCRDHFIEYVERGVRRVFRKYVPKRHEKILIAVSGGKDSLTLLYSLVPYLLNEGYSVSALFIDLGIRGYSDAAYEVVSENTGRLGVHLITVRLRDYGFTIDDVASLSDRGLLGKPVCSVCGLVKRYLYNKVAHDNGYDLVLTGHNLDDTLAYASQNIYSGNLAGLVKLRPYLPGREGLIAKAKPLIYTYEAETKWYVGALGIRILDRKCPYTPVKRNLVFDLKAKYRGLEENHPGIMRMAMRNIIDRLIPAVEKTVEKPRLVRCSVCGMPASTDPCGFCRTRRRILELLGRRGEEYM